MNICTFTLYIAMSQAYSGADCGSWPTYKFQNIPKIAISVLIFK